MMLYKKMLVRPRSTHTVYQFGGIWHNLENGGLSLENKLPCRWYDERNLGHDAYPAMSTRGGRPQVHRVAGMIIPNKMIATECTGANPVILDEKGILYCGGHSVNTIGENGIRYYWKFTYTKNTGQILTVTPESGSTTDSSELGGLLGAQTRTLTLTYDIQGGDLEMDECHWYLSDGTSTADLPYTYTQSVLPGLGWTLNLWDFTDYGFQIRSVGALDDGHVFTLKLWSEGAYPEGTYMVRMGANVLIMPEGVMVNVAMLEAGETVEVEMLNAEWSLPIASYMTLNPCLIDGTVITPVAGTTAPGDTTKIWADTTNDTTVLRHYVSALSSWEAIQETYIRIDIGDFVAGTDRNSDVLRQWDAIRLSPDKINIDAYDSSSTQFLIDSSTRLGREVQYILESSHVIYNRIDNTSTTPETHCIVIQGIIDETVTIGSNSAKGVQITRKLPQMDFIVECGNRLWGCYYGPDEEGNILNEIYASKLGDPRNWSVYMGLSTDSWTVSRGRDAPFTGAAVLDNSPLFFREQSLEKVYPSSSGAHQVQTFDLDGVEAGAHNTLVVIEEKLYYKHRRGVMCYTGTIPQMISRAFGDERYKGISACRYKYRYLICMRDQNIDTLHPNGHLLLGVYDIPTGEWHIETDGWEGAAVSGQDVVVYSQYRPAQGVTPAGYDNHQYNIGYLNNDPMDENSEWYAVSGLIGYELPEHRFISCIRVRLEMPQGSDVIVSLQYDSEIDTEGTQYTASTAMPINTKEYNLYPRRCDHFRIAFNGRGPCKIVSISYRMERSEGGH